MIEKRILHFGNDDKFLEKAFKEFNKFSHLAKSDFFIFSSGNLKYIKFPCKVVDSDFFQIPKVEEILNSYDLIIIHFLDERYDELLKNKKVITKIMWKGWGGDYYWLINTLPKFQILKPITKKILRESDNFLIKLLKKIRYRTRYKLLNRINYFSPVIKDDYDLIMQNYPDFKPNFIEWNYGNLEEDYVINDCLVQGQAILIGNSATKTNNHFDLMEILNHLKVKDLEIFIPISYGNSRYKTQLKNYLDNLNISTHVNYLENFMPYDEYLRILEKSGNVFMGHIRQQALGNVIALVYMGAQVFFFKESIVYKYLKNLGIKIYTFEDLINDKELLYKGLNETDIKRNQNILISLWGKKINEKNTNAIISLIQ